jgi:uncharacterized protein YehS (DUF1456 family)
MTIETHIFYWFCIVGLLALTTMVEVRNNLDMYAEIEKVKLNIVNDCLGKQRINIALKDKDILYMFDCGKFGHGTMTPIPK